MAINQPDHVESAAVKNFESSMFTAPQITKDDNQKLQELKINATANRKDAGILPELTISNDIEFVQKNFSAIDVSRDGHVTSREINSYIKDNKDLTSDEVASLQRVGAQIGKLEALSRDDGKNGVTVKDLDFANSNARAMDYAQRNFDGIDGNGDGHVTKDELDGYAKARGDQLSAEERANIENLKKNMSQLQGYSDDETLWETGFTRHDLVNGKKEQGTDVLRLGGKDNPDSGPKAYGDLRPALDYAQKNFRQMDADGDKYISADEIEQYMQKNKLSVEEMQNLRALKEKVGDIEEFSNDELFDEDNGISTKDIAAAEEQIDISVYAQKNFDKLDGNGDDFVEEDEIEAYIRANGSNISLEELRKLDTLKKAVGELEEKHDDEISDEDNGFTRHDLIDALEEAGSAGARDSEPESYDKPVREPEPREKPGHRPEPLKRDGEECPASDHEYTIQKGDSFWKIAKENLRAQNGHEPSNADIVKAMNELAKLNGMLLTHIIHPGQVLKVPGPSMLPPAPDQILKKKIGSLSLPVQVPADVTRVGNL